MSNKQSANQNGANSDLGKENSDQDQPGAKPQSNKISLVKKLFNAAKSGNSSSKSAETISALES